MRRLHQAVLIISAVLGSWLGMQAVHESGHVLAAWLTGGKVGRVVLQPLTLSRTDLADNPHPLLVVWAGPALGCLLPLLTWMVVAILRQTWAYLPRFFAGFCLVANGAYIAVGAFDGVGDTGVMLRRGSPLQSLLAFGFVTVPGAWLLRRGFAAIGVGRSSAHNEHLILGGIGDGEPFSGSIDRVVGGGNRENQRPHACGLADSCGFSQAFQ